MILKNRMQPEAQTFQTRLSSRLFYKPVFSEASTKILKKPGIGVLVFGKRARAKVQSSQCSRCTI